ncbi:hypothetical protein BSKO_05202 [Bryopsis sp. KO-2023]|nr:hypothetical protein BSKO_05202 [Bryopsis sp. KO-2023]
MVSKKLVDGLIAPMTRSFVALFVVTSLAFTIKSPGAGKKRGPDETEEAHFIHLTFMWLAMVNFIIAAPKIGSVAKTSTQNVIGSAVGATTGVGIVAAAWSADLLRNASWFALCMSLVGLTANALGWAFKIPQFSMFMVLSACMIVFCNEDPTNATFFMLSRIVGMIAGVLMANILAVLIYPKTATQEVVSSLVTVLDGLSGLNQIAWSHTVKHALGPLSSTDSQNRGQKKMEEDDDDKKGFIKLAAGVCKDGECGIAQAVVTSQLETALMKVYNGLEAAEAAMPLTRTEVAFKVFGYWVFMPSISWVKRQPLPEEDIATLAWSIRKCARVLWTVSLTFQDGLDEDMVEALRQRYPSNLMANLKDASTDVFEDFVESFPASVMVPTTNIENFREAVESLFAINDYYRTKISSHMRKYKELALESGLKSDPEILREAADEKKRLEEQSNNGRKPADSKSDSLLDPLLSKTSEYDDSESKPPALEKLQRTNTMDLKTFPDTAEGYVSMVRWYSFQFLLTEVYKDMEELHKNLNVVLGRMPDYGVKGLR